MKNLNKYFLVFCLTLCISCGQQFTFRKEHPSMELSNGIYFYPYQKSQEVNRQDVFAKNEMSVLFQVMDRDGVSITGLTASDFIVMENGIPITSTSLTIERPRGGVDIVFVIDETNSMSDIINTVKANVRAFVANLGSKDMKSNLCLVTFRDTVTRVCDHIIEDVPTTPQDENSDAFLDALSTINATGGGDFPENQLAGIQQAALVTPWKNGNQRVAILITDEKFHYAPEARGDAGAAAPYYEDVIDTIQEKEMMTFTIGPTFAGYTSGFKGRPSISDATGADHFSIDAVIANAGEMNKIFGIIAERLATKYQIRYSAEDNGLDPALTLAQRNITVTLRNPIPGATVRMVSRSSTFPLGHPEQRRTWTLNPAYAINESSLEVWVNGNLSAIPYNLVGSDLTFATAPPPGAEIMAKYEFISLRNNIRVEPIFAKPTPEMYTFKVMFNHMPTTDADVRISRDLEGRNVIEPQPSVFDESDPFHIKENGGLLVTFELIPI